MTEELHEYAFDIYLAGAIRVKAPSLTLAVKMLNDQLDSVSADLGFWPDGSPVQCEVSMLRSRQIADGPSLFEVDGEDA